jgi:hypothetical protein
MDDRSERLRKRRKQSNATSDDQPVSEATSDSPGSSEPSEPSEPSKLSRSEERSDQADDGEGPVPVKEQQTGTYMYLPETQVKHLRRQYNVLKAEYEFEYNEEFEKNRHFYPLVVQYGLERLDDLDTSQIRSRLNELYE